MSLGAYLFSTFFVLGLIPSFSQAQITITHLDVQDVSYLWPEYNESTLLPAIGKTKNEDLIPSRKVYKKLQDFLSSESDVKVKNTLTGQLERPHSGTDTVTDTRLEEFHVVGFRVDNCGPFAGHINAKTQTWVIRDGKKSLVEKQAQCAPQIRLVLQPVMHWEDVALHFVYTFKNEKGEGDAEILRTMAEDLLRLKKQNPINTSGRNLGPNEGLKDPKFSAAVIGFIKKYAQPKALSEIAVLSTNAFDGNNEWIFTSIEVNQNNPDELTLKPHLALKGSPLTQAFESKSSQHKFERPAVGLDNPETASLETTLTLSNPRQTSNQSVDCLSCHSETRTMIFKAIHNPAEWAQLSAVKNKLPAFKNISGLPDPKFLPTDIDGVEGNFRHFGYFNSQPVVTFRSAFESAEVASAFNKILFKGPPQESSSADILGSMQKIISESLSRKF
jgi:hypothetical protein